MELLVNSADKICVILTDLSEIVLAGKVLFLDLFDFGTLTYRRDLFGQF
jgi:hypothetical protein